MGPETALAEDRINDPDVTGNPHVTGLDDYGDACGYNAAGDLIVAFGPDPDHDVDGRELDGDEWVVTEYLDGVAGRPFFGTRAEVLDRVKQRMAAG